MSPQSCESGSLRLLEFPASAAPRERSPRGGGGRAAGQVVVMMPDPEEIRLRILEEIEARLEEQHQQSRVEFREGFDDGAAGKPAKVDGPYSYLCGWLNGSDKRAEERAGFADGRAGRRPRISGSYVYLEAWERGRRS